MGHPPVQKAKTLTSSRVTEQIGVVEKHEESLNGLIIQRAIEKAQGIEAKLSAVIADLEATGVLTKQSKAGKHLLEARSGLCILLKILRREIDTGPPFGLQRP